MNNICLVFYRGLVVQLNLTLILALAWGLIERHTLSLTRYISELWTGILNLAAWLLLADLR